jgi:hypothetical protein
VVRSHRSSRSGSAGPRTAGHSRGTRVGERPGGLAHPRKRPAGPASRGWAVDQRRLPGGSRAGGGGQVGDDRAVVAARRRVTCSSARPNCSPTSCSASPGSARARRAPASPAWRPTCRFRRRARAGRRMWLRPVAEDWAEHRPPSRVGRNHGRPRDSGFDQRNAAVRLVHPRPLWPVVVPAGQPQAVRAALTHTQVAGDVARDLGWTAGREPRPDRPAGRAEHHRPGSRCSPSLATGTASLFSV